MQIIEGAFHVLAAQAGAVCDKLFLAVIAPNCRNCSMVKIRTQFHEHLPFGSSLHQVIEVLGTMSSSVRNVSKFYVFELSIEETSC